jgi:hypothetical protein
VLRNPTPQDLTKYYRATVHAGTSDVAQDRLKQYNARMKQLAGVSDLEVAWIGCIHCADVESGTHWPDLIYIFYREHERSLKMLARAWRDVQRATDTQAEIRAFTIKFDAEPLPGTACPPPPPTCTNVPSCISTDRCDKYFPTPAGCQKCQ